MGALSTEDLRLALFFAARAARHQDYPQEDTSQEDSMVEELILRNGEEWLQRELARLRDLAR